MAQILSQNDEFAKPFLMDIIEYRYDITFRVRTNRKAALSDCDITSYVFSANKRAG